MQNQTGDVSFLVDTMIEASADPDSPVAGLVDGERIGASGHSNGAITTIGATLHTCCVDERIDAAVAFAGTDSPFAGGEYDWSLAPPFLIVHGTLDEQVSYSSGVGLYNNLAGPKGLLTLDGGDHIAMFDPDGSGSTRWSRRRRRTSSVAYLADDAAAVGRLQTPSVESDAVGLPLRQRRRGRRSRPDHDDARARPRRERRARRPVWSTVSRSRWPGVASSSDGSINVLQCSDADEGAGFCDLTNGQVLVPNPTGDGTIDLEIVVGPVGEGSCGPGVTGCVIAVNDSGLADPDATIYVPLEFAD